MRSNRNLFRFVALRPPVVEEREPERRLVDHEAADDFVADVQARFEQSEMTWGAARVATGQDVLDSDTYFTRHPGWQPLRPLRDALLVVMYESTAERTVDPAREASEVLAPVLGGRYLEQWTTSDEYADLRRALWRSYFANIVAPGDRAHDRVEILDWARLLVFLESIAGGDVYASERARRLMRARFEVPSELFMRSTREVEGPEAEEQVAVEEGRVDELRELLGRHEAARSQLEAIHRQKLARIRMAGRPSPQPVEEMEERAGENEPGYAEGGMERSAVPWRLTEDDLAGHDELRAELERLRLPVDGTYIGEISAAIDQQMADETSELTELTTTEAVVGVGARMSVIRTTRPMVPGSFARRT